MIIYKNLPVLVVGAACVFTKIALSFYYTGMLLIAVSAVAMLIDILTITGRMHRNRTQSANAAASA